MTKDEILKMEAGRELDALVADRVMGWKSTGGRHLAWEKGNGLITWEDSSWGNGFRPSTEIYAAWEVVEKFFRKGTQTLIIGCRGRAFSFRCYWNGNRGEAIADSAPLAICRAALMAVMGEEEAEKKESDPTDISREERNIKLFSEKRREENENREA